MNALKSASDLQKAFENLRSDTCSSQEKLEIGAAIVMEQHFDCYEEVIAVLDPLHYQYEENPLWNFVLGFAKSVVGLAESAILHLRKALAHENNLHVFHGLTWAYLQSGAYPEAMVASSAGLQYFPNNDHLLHLLKLSKVKAQGLETYRFNCDGCDYTFNVFTSNTQEIEAAVTHGDQKLTEIEELRMVRNHVGEVGAIAEVGCLVGNHSVYFLKNLRPQRLTLIDACTTSLEHAAANVALNQDPARPAQVSLIHSAVGEHETHMAFKYETVPVNSLDNLLHEPYDFIKIDVDGMEMETLRGMSNTLQRFHPKIMIEVLNILRKPFQEFLALVGYRIIAKNDRINYSNYLIGPAD